ncbi:MAG: hypothetical protein CMJ59_24845 [Planctomycetaceae bacterium]|nr:hypothetical protein [Planctomycetaceae bacterium]
MADHVDAPAGPARYRMRSGYGRLGTSYHETSPRDGYQVFEGLGNAESRSICHDSTETTPWSDHGTAVPGTPSGNSEPTRMHSEVQYCHKKANVSQALTQRPALDLLRLCCATW